LPTDKDRRSNCSNGRQAGREAQHSSGDNQAKAGIATTDQIPAHEPFEEAAHETLIPTLALSRIALPNLRYPAPARKSPNAHCLAIVFFSISVV
jgi:hypothetical protein